MFGAVGARTGGQLGLSAWWAGWGLAVVLMVSLIGPATADSSPTPTPSRDVPEPSHDREGAVPAHDHSARNATGRRSRAALAPIAADRGGGGPSVGVGPFRGGPRSGAPKIRASHSPLSAGAPLGSRGPGRGLVGRGASRRVEMAGRAGYGICWSPPDGNLARSTRPISWNWSI